jgi:hypothetical protein
MVNKFSWWPLRHRHSHIRLRLFLLAQQARISTLGSYMDFTILYRVLWKPRDVAKQFIGKIRIEPFIFAIAWTVLSYLWYFTDLIKTPLLLIVRMLQGLSVLLIFPAINAAIAFLIIRFIFKIRFNFIQLFSLFILCGLPYYIEGLLIAIFHYNPSTGAGSLIQHFGDIHPFLFGMISMITPFFIWIVFLWRGALYHILSERQAKVVLGTLFVVDLIVSGLWRYLKTT